MARWSDLIIGDVNRLFDQSALLHGLTVQNSWRTSVLVDEAHNLVDRARGMYSVELDQQRLLRVRKTAPKALKAALDRVARAWQRLVREFGEQPQDRKSTRLNSSHVRISYAVFCLKKKK